jgi:glycosyltransferase involved in cell wall biosynthesis
MLSLLVPVYNEEESLAELAREIDAVCGREGWEYELLFIDDGSRDRSWEVIQQLVAQSPRVRAIRFRRNFGKAAALSAGMAAARGETLMMLDADLQDDPVEIPRYLARLAEGYDVVNGWKKHRLDPWHKTYPSRVFNAMVSRLTGLSLHDHNCGMKCFRKEVAQELRLYGELHRFIPVLAFARGFRVSELDIHHRVRKFGHSKYGIRRFLRGFLDLLTVSFLTGFGQRPAHALGGWGLFFTAVGAAGLGYLGVIWLLTNLAGLGLGKIGDRPLLAYSIASLLVGGQLISLGFLAELIVSNTQRPGDSYSVAERIGLPPSE